MTKDEAEQLIGVEVRKIDRIRLSDLPEAEQASQIAEVETQIKALVEVTGPRHLVGRKVR